MALRKFVIMTRAVMFFTFLTSHFLTLFNFSFKAFTGVPITVQLSIRAHVTSSAGNTEGSRGRRSDTMTTTKAVLKPWFHANILNNFNVLF